MSLLSLDRGLTIGLSTIGRPSSDHRDSRVGGLGVWFSAFWQAGGLAELRSATLARAGPKGGESLGETFKVARTT